MDEHFYGFSPETLEILIGIRMNNNKEWFGEHRDAYKEYVHQPFVALGNEIYNAMKSHDPNFADHPKISRVNRDIRFSKVKFPYKDSKWILFRQGQTSSIKHEEPTYFFELFPDHYHYGLGFWPSPKGLDHFRKKLAANISAAQTVIRQTNAINSFPLQAEYYKKPMSKDLPDDVARWAQCKHLNFICDRKNDSSLFQQDLPELIVKDFLQLYPTYQYFLQ